MQARYHELALETTAGESAYRTGMGHGALLEPSTSTARFTTAPPKSCVSTKVICVCPLTDGARPCTGTDWPLIVTCKRLGLNSTVWSRLETLMLTTSCENAA